MNGMNTTLFQLRSLSKLPLKRVSNLNILYYGKQSAFQNMERKSIHFVASKCDVSSIRSPKNSSSNVISWGSRRFYCEETKVNDEKQEEKFETTVLFRDESQLKYYRYYSALTAFELFVFLIIMPYLVQNEPDQEKRNARANKLICGGIFIGLISLPIIMGLFKRVTMLQQISENTVRVYYYRFFPGTIHHMNFPIKSMYFENPKVWSKWPIARMRHSTFSDDYAHSFGIWNSISVPNISNFIKMFPTSKGVLKFQRNSPINSPVKPKE